MQNIMRRMTIVWSLLIVATVLSWFLGGGADAGNGRAAAVAILIVAMVKTRLVIMHFMDIGRAPLPLKLACEAWILLLGAAMTGLYLFG